jgi:hypothetical protein
LAGSEEGDLGCEPSNEHIYCKTPNDDLVAEAQGQARVHYEHAHFDGVYQVEHHLLRDNDDLGAVDPILYVFGCEGLLQSRRIQIRPSAICDDIQEDYESRVKQLCVV